MAVPGPIPFFIIYLRTVHIMWTTFQKGKNSEDNWISYGMEGDEIINSDMTGSKRPTHRRTDP